MGKAIPFPGGSPKEAGYPPRVYPISAVPRIARICALGLAFDELLDEVCREILALSGADGGCLFLCIRDERPDTFSTASSTGTPPDVGAAYRPGPAFERLLAESTTEIALAADAGGGTLVRVTLDQRPRGWARFSPFQLRAAARRQAADALEGLAGLLGDES